MVPLNTTLKNGQRVEVVTTKQGGPSRDWLNPELGYVQSHRARTKVRQWFKAQQHEQTVAQGRATVERELQRAGATAVNLDAVAAKAGFDKADDFYAAVARDDVNLRQIQTAIKAVMQPSMAPQPEAEPEVLARQSKSTGAGSGILVVGVDRLMTALARCCKPAPPDPIVGFVTRGRGVSIHRQGCASVARMRAREPERLIVADWGAPREEVFPVDVVLEAMDRQGLLRDVTEILSRERINVTAAKTLTRNMDVRMAFTLEVKSLDQLSRALAYVRQVPGVLSAARR
jgi:GTP pyrophosphokinase